MKNWNKNNWNKHSINIWFLFAFHVFIFHTSAQANTQKKSPPPSSPTLQTLLAKVYHNNPMLSMHRHSWDAEKSLITHQYTPEDPMVGFSNLSRGNTTQYGTVSQKLKFPVKYALAGKAQTSRSRYKKDQYEIDKIKNQTKYSFSLLFYLLCSKNYSAHSKQTLVLLKNLQGWQKKNMQQEPLFNRIK